ncbi:hypothetical protein TRIUR3_05554 [Triticum urartu]|uniref:Uncharacterized protein n=1 Tax=Triticum urartu TaxID=4572 RepID=M8A5I6_TRIUA|nr:hypothetical protein TRIUR3_05554 [Triticum urartu]
MTFVPSHARRLATAAGDDGHDFIIHKAPYTNTSIRATILHPREGDQGAPVTDCGGYSAATDCGGYSTATDCAEAAVEPDAISMVAPRKGDLAAAAAALARRPDDLALLPARDV